MADNKGKTLLNKAWRITSMAEFHSYYGYAPDPKFNIKNSTKDAAAEPDFKQADNDYYLDLASERFLLYRCMQLFFQNGGGLC